ncbi:MAG TPA: hypothetical protein VE420_10155 [Gemmatimonadales bacterium]|jgi:hypothetical protein|nr:hypothetical protein [Gemmatimonadales bacterium]
MSRERQAQWAHRLERLHALRKRFTIARHYDRASLAYLTIQRLYDRWADEVFYSQREPCRRWSEVQALFRFDGLIGMTHLLAIAMRVP